MLTATSLVVYLAWTAAGCWLAGRVLACRSAKSGARGAVLIGVLFYVVSIAAVLTRHDSHDHRPRRVPQATAEVQVDRPPITQGKVESD